MTEKEERNERWTVSEVLKSMSSSVYPDYVIKAAEQVCLWMKESIKRASEEATDDVSVEYDRLYSSLEWLKDHANFIGESDRAPGSEAVIISLETTDLDDAMRIALDHVAIFSRGTCKKVWIISDTWLPGDVLRYRKHMDALLQEEITFRFLLVTPGGWTEIPLYENEFKGRKSLPWNDGKTGKTV